MPFIVKLTDVNRVNFRVTLMLIKMPSVINELCELADISEVEAFFNRRGFAFIANSIVNVEDGTLADEYQILDLASDFELCSA